MEELEDEDVAEDEELVRCALLRGINIRVTSSAPIGFNAPCPPSLVFHRGKDWKLGGDATAVIGVMLQRVVEYRCCVSGSWRFLSPNDECFNLDKMSVASRIQAGVVYSYAREMSIH